MFQNVRICGSRVNLIDDLGESWQLPRVFGMVYESNMSHDFELIEGVFVCYGVDFDVEESWADVAVLVFAGIQVAKECVHGIWIVLGQVDRVCSGFLLLVSLRTVFVDPRSGTYLEAALARFRKEFGSAAEDVLVKLPLLVAAGDRDIREVARLEQAVDMVSDHLCSAILHLIPFHAL